MLFLLDIWNAYVDKHFRIPLNQMQLRVTNWYTIFKSPVKFMKFMIELSKTYKKNEVIAINSFPTYRHFQTLLQQTFF